MKGYKSNHQVYKALFGHLFFFLFCCQNMSDAMAILHKLQTGLDVNVKFTGVRVFEYTPECIVFDLLDIPLYHGWLVDPQVIYSVSGIFSKSYSECCWWEGRYFRILTRQ